MKIQSEQARQAEPMEKKAYIAPKLSTHGNVQKLTGWHWRREHLCSFIGR